jgi:hypothetical protein
MSDLIPKNTDEEIERYMEADMVRRARMPMEGNAALKFEHDPVTKRESAYFPLSSGGYVKIGDRAVTPEQASETDVLAAERDIQNDARGPISEVMGGAGGPVLDDYLAAGFTEAEVTEYQAQERARVLGQPGMQVPVQLTEEQMQFGEEVGAPMLVPRATSLRDRVQDIAYTGLSQFIDDPNDLRFWSNYLTDVADIMAPGVGGAISVDEGARLFNQGVEQGNAVDMLIGSALTTLGVAELVPLVRGLSEPARIALTETLSPAAKNLLADTVGASRAIAQGDREMLMEIFQPAGTPRSLGAAAPDPETAGAITAFHGSPYDFDAFDITKMGTGEGAQAYGPGLYFAENENVAREYRDSMLDARIPPLNDRLREVAREMSEISTGYRQWRSGQEERGRALAAEYDGLMDQRSSMRGRLYQVNIQANPEDFLNWDAPISQQSEKVRDALMPFVERRIAQMGEAGNRFTTEQWMDRLRGGDVMLLDKVEDTPVSNALIEAGVPGVRYFDQSSRAAGEGTRNIVVFDDQLIDIVRKYGVAGLAIGAAVQSELGVNEQIEENT